MKKIAGQRLRFEPRILRSTALHPTNGLSVLGQVGGLVYVFSLYVYGY